MSLTSMPILHPMPHPAWRSSSAVSRRRFCALSRMTMVVLLGAVGSLFGHAAQAQSAGATASGPAGEVEFARGVGYAQTPGQTPRILGKGLAFKEGDTLSTAAGATAIVRLQDGSRMTLRPGTDLVVQQFRYAPAASNNSMVLQLFAGGLRAITGLITKDAPEAARLQTKTSTIGIRGTDFDARICQRDCGAESARVDEKARANTVQASAKLVGTQGDIMAVDAAGVRRRLVDGAAIYPGETVETGTTARGVLAFRDDSRLTLGAATRFRVDTFVFDDKNPGEGRFLVSLLRGSARALTGLIGRANNRNVGFTTATATIGVRGTGLDMQCEQDDRSCKFFTWLGTIEVTPTGASQGTGLSAMQILSAGQGLLVDSNGIRPVGTPILEDLPRPDTVPVDTKQLFSEAAMTGDPEGLYVFVRDGHIEITTASETLQLGKGETGFAGDNGHTVRPLLMPLFLEFDRTPKPDSANPMLQSILNETGARPANQCR